MVADAWQRRGIGRELISSAIEVARAEHASEIVARLSPENRAMRTLLEEAGFAFEERGALLLATLPTT